MMGVPLTNGLGETLAKEREREAAGSCGCGQWCRHECRQN
jgi:hypothetical protein